MNQDTKILEPLLEKVEALSKNSLLILKLQFLELVSTVLAELFSKLIWFSLIFLLVIMLSITFGLWMGWLLGNYYLGFGVLSFVFLIGLIAMYFCDSWIKLKFNQSFVSILFKKWYAKS